MSDERLLLRSLWPWPQVAAVPQPSSPHGCCLMLGCCLCCGAWLVLPPCSRGAGRRPADARHGGRGCGRTGRLGAAGAQFQGGTALHRCRGRGAHHPQSGAQASSLPAKCCGRAGMGQGWDGACVPGAARGSAVLCCAVFPHAWLTVLWLAWAVQIASPQHSMWTGKEGSFDFTLPKPLRVMQLREPAGCPRRPCCGLGCCKVSSCGAWAPGGEGLPAAWAGAGDAVTVARWRELNTPWLALFVRFSLPSSCWFYYVVILGPIEGGTLLGGAG